MGHSVCREQTSTLNRELADLKRKVKKAIFLKRKQPEINRHGSTSGFQSPYQSCDDVRGKAVFSHHISLTKLLAAIKAKAPKLINLKGVNCTFR